MVDQVNSPNGDLVSRVERIVAALRQSAQLAIAQEASGGQGSAYLDDLTGTLTRGAGRQQLSDEIERAHRSLTALAVAFVDVDGLKLVNDTHGHAEGDRLLIAVTTALRQNMRQYDLIMRNGGDEFLCALPGSGCDAARAVIERALVQLQTEHPGASFSAGFAELLPDEEIDQLVCRADGDLYDRRALPVHRSSPPRAAPSTNGGPPSTVQAPGIGCAACGERIPLSTFVLAQSKTLARFADCPRCAETTVIQLSAPSLL